MARHSACRGRKKAMLSGKTSLNTPKIRAGTSLGIWPCSFLCDYRRNQTAMKKRYSGLHRRLQIQKCYQLRGASMSPRWSSTLLMMCIRTWGLSPWQGLWKTTFKSWHIFSGKQKHRTSSMETSVLLWQNIRTFAQRSPMFYCFRTATSHSPFPLLYKKSFWNSPTFPTPRREMPCIYWWFRVKDRV